MPDGGTLHALQALPALTSLTVEGWTLTLADVASTAARLPALRSLAAAVGSEGAARLSALTQLSSLAVGSPRLTPSPAAPAPRTSRLWPAAGVDPRGLGPGGVAAVLQLHQLAALHIPGTHLSAALLGRLPRELPGLQELALDPLGRHFAPEGIVQARFLDAVRQLTRLR